MKTEKFSRGWRNQYRAGMPRIEVWLKDIRLATKDLYFWLSGGFHLRTVCCYPDFPSRKTTISKIADRLKFRLSNKPLKQPDVVIAFDDQTLSKNDNWNTLFAGSRILNQYCLDISKTKVDAIHQEVFGYSTRIDPLVFRGEAVEKSDENARHDGQIVMCPVAIPRSNAIYQMVLDNEVDSDFVVDMRVPVYGHTIPLAYLKFKSHSNRFTNEVDRSELHETSALLSEAEQHSVITFCKKMGADFCELDILRHKGDGRIYIIDLNKTPYGPPRGLKKAETQKAIHLLTESFRKEFLES